MVILNASDPDTAKKINDVIKNTKHVFILVYMVGCGPCNATRPEWKKMCQTFENKYSSNDEVAILDLDSQFMNEVKVIGDVSGFPTMKYISNNGNIIESFEDSNIPDKKRTSNSFINWIDSKVLTPITSRSLTNNENKNSFNVDNLSEKLSSKQRNSAKSLKSMKYLKSLKSIGIKKSSKKRKNKKTKSIKSIKSIKSKNSRKNRKIKK
jgi:thiol-disulfide isomerase/thioredoxin